MKRELALGVDIGGTNTVFGIVDRGGKVHFEASVSTKEAVDPHQLVSQIFDVIATTEYQSDIIAIGVGAPNGNYYSGNIEFAPNLQWKGIVPLAAMFEDKFGVKTTLTNDANAAAVGELLFGVAKGMDHFVTITLGTGLGSGVVIDGKIVYGHDGLAGEYGHIRIVKEGRQCGCGRKGCLETYVSATGVVRSISEFESPNKSNSRLLKLENPSSKDVCDAAMDGDAFAKEILEYTTDILGSALADFTCFSSPKAYVLFGGLAQSGQRFADKVKEQMEANMLSIYKNKVDILISSLQNENAAVLGSAATAFLNSN